MCSLFRSRALGALLFAGALALPVAQAGVVPVHFNFENTGANPAATDNVGHDSLGFSRSGLNLTVTALQAVPSILVGQWGAVTAASNGAGAGVYFGNTGLGVYLGGTDDNSMDGADGPAGGSDRDEALIFRFDRVVTLTAVNFGRWDGRVNYAGTFDPFQGDLVRLHVDGVTSLHYGGADDHPSLSFTGTEFMFLADEDGTNVRIQDLDVTFSVPEPAGLSLAVIGLAGLGGVRRRVSGRSR